MLLTTQKFGTIMHYISETKHIFKKIFVPLMAHVPQKQMSLVKVTKEIVRAHTSFLQSSRDSGSLIESLVSMAKLVLLCTTTTFLHIMDSSRSTSSYELVEYLLVFTLLIQHIMLACKVHIDLFTS